jgi:hypothetical protein
MIEDVDESITLLWFVERRPVSDAFHSVPVEDLYRVFAEACQQVCQFSLGGVIDAEFVDSGRGLGRIGVIGLRSGPECCREEGRRRNCLEQGSSFHGGILAECLPPFAKNTRRVGHPCSASFYLSFFPFTTPTPVHKSYPDFALWVAQLPDVMSV